MRLAWLGLALGCVACDGSAGDDLGGASQAAAPHLQAFGSFERWARRTCDGSLITSQHDALTETVFAPLRGMPDVQAAWVRVQQHAGTITLGLPADVALPVVAKWVTLRDPVLGMLQVAPSEVCPVAGTSTRPAPPRCVLVARNDRAPHDGSLEVTIAFRSRPNP
jgi:hypothetical protein